MGAIVRARRSTTTRSRSVSTERALLHDVRELIVEARTRVARATNATLTLTYWRIGERIRRVVLGEKRADYGRHVIERLATNLTQEFGDGFSRANLFNMVRFAEVFADPQIVQTLSGQLTWSHFCILIYQEKPLEREFYAAMCADQHWNVRELRRQIQEMLYERVALSKKPEAVVDRAIKALRDTGEMSPDMVLLDPINLSALGLKDDLGSERDLEPAGAVRGRAIWIAAGDGVFRRRVEVGSRKKCRIGFTELRRHPSRKVRKTLGEAQMRRWALATLATCALILTSPVPVSAADTDAAPIYQLRVYGLVDKTKAAFHARFRDHAKRIMERHGFTIIAIWETREPSGPAFVYLLKWPDEAALKKSWAAFLADPEWVKTKAETPAADRPIMREVEQDRVLHIVDYSPTRP